MTVPSTRPASPSARLRRRLSGGGERGALSAEFAVLLAVGAGMAFLLYSALKSGGVVGAIVGVVVGIIKGLVGGIG